MFMQKIEKYLSAILTAVLGILFIVLRQDVISIAMTIAGVVLIAMGIMDLVNHSVSPAIVKFVVGAVVIVFGWAFVSVVLYIVAAALVIYGAISIYNLIRFRTKGANLWDTVLMYAVPIMWIIIGFLLFFNMSGTLSGIILAVGIILLVQALLLFIDAFRNKK